MATYPGGVYAPSAKAAGNTIQASFFNDPEAEITAVEDALKNGIAHAVSIAGALTVSTGGLTVSTGSVNLGGPSSVATLQVNGTSTFVGAVTLQGALTVGGAFTFDGPIVASSGLTVSTGVIRQNSLPSFSVWSTAAVALENGSSVQGISFTAQDFVRGNIAHSTATESSRVTITTTGVYRLDVHALVTSAADPFVTIQLRLNDTTTLLSGFTGFNSGQRPRTVSFGGPIRIASTGFLGVRALSEGGSTSTIGSTDASMAARLTGYLLG